MARLLCAIIVPCLAVLAGPAVGQSLRPVEPITGLPLPLLEGEQLVRLRDGCNVIVAPGASPASLAATAQLRWYGACRFGLTDGPGFIQGQDGQTFPYQDRLGRRDRRPGKRKGDASEYFPRNKVRDTEFWFELYASPQEALAAEQTKLYKKMPTSLTDDRQWSTSLAYARRKDAREDTTEYVDVGNLTCPPLGPHMTVAKAVAEQVQLYGFPPEQLKLLTLFCEVAYSRLKPIRLNKWDLPYGVEPFKQADFGYFYKVEFRRTVQLAGQEAKATKQTTICPAPGDLKSCEAIWRPLLAPMIAARDAERKKEADIEAEREALIAPLEAAFAAKLKFLSQPATPRRAR